jgi:hypothetical protein
MDYQNVKLMQARRQKVIMLSIIISIFIHLLFFFAFRIKFLGYKTVKVSKIMRIRRLTIPPGQKSGAASKSTSKRRARQATPKKKSRPRPKRLDRRGLIKSKAKVIMQDADKLPTEEEIEAALNQQESLKDIMSMVKDGMIEPGGGNMGDGDMEGLTYDENAVYEYGYDEEEDDFASIQPEKFLGTLAPTIVTSVPPTSITKTFTDIPYPDEVKIKQERLQSGICRVFLRLTINRSGEIVNIYVRSPKREDDKVKYKIFLDSVLNTVHTWDYDPVNATVFVDVRFTIE